MTIYEVIGALVAISSIYWPPSHYSHNCPPRKTWKDSICPEAQLKEAVMFLQIALGISIMWIK